MLLQRTMTAKSKQDAARRRQETQTRRSRPSPEPHVDTRGGAPTQPARYDEDLELVETLRAMLLQQRLVEFARTLDPIDRWIFEHRMLSLRPAPLGKIARTLEIPLARALDRVRSLETRMRIALRDPCAAD